MVLEAKILLVYCICISVIGVFMTIYDKRAAKRKKRRVPERTLLTVGILGAALPMYLAMLTIRHKTRHKKFMWGLPCIILVQIGLLYMWYTYLPMPL